MAHFAKLDENNIVIQVVSVSNEVLIDSIGNESEQKGIDFLYEQTGHLKWKQTSYNRNFRKNYAGYGMEYNEDADVFLFPKPDDSWTFSLEEKDWIPPIPYPQDGLMYHWDINSKQWTEITGQ